MFKIAEISKIRFCSCNELKYKVYLFRLIIMPLGRVLLMVVLKGHTGHFNFCSTNLIFSMFAETQI